MWKVQCTYVLPVMSTTFTYIESFLCYQKERIIFYQMESAACYEKESTTYYHMVGVRYHSGGSMKLNACILLFAHMVYL